MAGEICHVELISTDLEATRKLTSELFTCLEDPGGTVYGLWQAARQ